MPACVIQRLIVEGHEMVRDARAESLGGTPEFQVVGVASSLRAALPIQFAQVAGDVRSPR